MLSLVSATPERLIAYPTGAGETPRLERGTIEHYTAARWFRDGKRVAVCGNEPGNAPRCFVQDSADAVIVANGGLSVRIERFHLGTRRRELIRTHAPANQVGVSLLYNPILAADPNMYADGLIRRLSWLFLIEGAK